MGRAVRSTQGCVSNKPCVAAPYHLYNYSVQVHKYTWVCWVSFRWTGTRDNQAQPMCSRHGSRTTERQERSWQFRDRAAGGASPFQRYGCCRQPWVGRCSGSRYYCCQLPIRPRSQYRWPQPTTTTPYDEATPPPPSHYNPYGRPPPGNLDVADISRPGAVEAQVRTQTCTP